MKKTALLFIGTFFVLSFNVNAQSSVADGEKAIKNKEYSKALTIAKEFIDSNNTTDALRLLIQLREKNFSDIKLFEYLGDTYSKMNVAENAIINYEQAEAMDSLNIQLKFKSAELLSKSKKYTDAVNKYLKVIAIDPNNKTAYLKAATIFYSAKLYADAAVMYEKYLGIDQSQEAFENIAKAFREIKNYEKAYKYAVEGLVKYPGDAALTKSAAIASFGLQKFEDAGKYYSAIPDSQLTVSDLKNAGKAFQMIKADSISIKYFEKVIAKDPSQSSLFMEMANIYFRNKDNERAVKYYLAKIKIDPNYELAYRYMGFANFAMEKWDNARQAFLKAKELVDTTFMTNYWLAQTYSQMDSTQQASDQYIRSLKLSEGKERQYKDEIYGANFFLGKNAYDKQNYNAALPYLKKILQFKSGDVGTTEMIAICYHQLQNYDEAIKWYRAVLKLNPKSEVAKKGLRRLSAD
ncbi:MAG: tetratricopeptide repeat protein [Ignavibacteriales bacterium]|nr:MAG: tetratricopeptide repeat protein [Ignavibacteriales bacterium]